MNDDYTEPEDMTARLLPFPGPPPGEAAPPAPVPTHRYTDIGLTTECAQTTIAKGFNVKNWPAQVLLIAEEVGEALENFEQIEDPDLAALAASTVALSKLISRKRAEKTWADGFALREDHNLLEELADIEIRRRSFIGGNGLTAYYRQALWNKMDKNKERPQLHGKKN